MKLEKEEEGRGRKEPLGSAGVRDGGGVMLSVTKGKMVDMAVVIVMVVVVVVVAVLVVVEAVGG